jgi:hypothetical protein
LRIHRHVAAVRQPEQKRGGARPDSGAVRVLIVLARPIAVVEIEIRLHADAPSSLLQNPVFGAVWFPWTYVKFASQL